MPENDHNLAQKEAADRQAARVNAASLANPRTSKTERHEQDENSLSGSAANVLKEAHVDTKKDLSKQDQESINIASTRTLFRSGVVGRGVGAGMLMRDAGLVDELLDEISPEKNTQKANEKEQDLRYEQEKAREKDKEERRQAAEEVTLSITIMAKVEAAWNRGVTWIKNKTAALYDSAKEWFSDKWESISESCSKAWETAKDYGSKALDYALELPGKAVDIAKEYGSKAVDKALELGSSALGACKSGLTSLSNTFGFGEDEPAQTNARVATTPQRPSPEPEEQKGQLTEKAMQQAKQLGNTLSQNFNIGQANDINGINAPTIGGAGRQNQPVGRTA